MPVAKVRRADFVISVRARGEIKSTRSVILSAPQVPDTRIVKLTESGRAVKKGEVVVEFDAAQQEQTLLERTTTVRTAESELVQTKASHTIDDEADAMNLMLAQYNVQRAKLEASKAEIVSEIDGAKNRIQVGVSQGEQKQVETSIDARKVSHTADLERLDQKKDKTLRDVAQAQSYLSKMVIKAPIDGIVNVLPNFKSGGSFGQSPPGFKEGDRAWTGAAIAEIPDLSEMRMELKLEEVDRGKLKLGQPVKIRVDAIPEKEFVAEMDWISPIAALVYKGLWRFRQGIPLPGDVEEPGSSSAARHERFGRDHHRAGAQCAPDTLAGELPAEGQACRLRAERAGVFHAHHRGGPPQ